MEGAEEKGITVDMKCLSRQREVTSRNQVEELTGGEVGKGRCIHRTRKRGRVCEHSCREVCLLWEDEVVVRCICFSVK